MITYLNKVQLAFILDIKAEEARAKMCNAWAKSKGIPLSAEHSIKGKVEDKYPEAMPVELLEEHVSPWLRFAVKEITENYLKRAATKKYILCDFPEKELLKQAQAGRHPNSYTINIPPGLKSLLPDAVQKEIKDEWAKRYNVASH